MGSSARVARIAGIDIRVHVTFLLVVLLGAWQWGGSGARGVFFGAGLTLSVFVCVVLHELGHSLVAKAFGIPVKDITLLPIGGVAQLGRRPDTPLQEVLIAAAGPLVNVGLAAVLWALAPDLGAAWWKLDEVPLPSLRTWWSLLYNANLVLAAFNMLPAFPMDGGRFLRAVLSWFLSLERATRIAVRVGRVFAFVIFAVGLLWHSPTLPVLAVFVFLGGGSELQEVLIARLLSGIRLGDAVNPYLPRFQSGTTVAEAVQALVFSPSSAFGVEEAGRLLGVVTRGAITGAARDAALDAPVFTLMERDVPTLASHESLETARQRMGESGRAYVAVESQGTFLGLVTEAEFARQAALAQVLQSQRPAQVRWPRLR